MYSKLPEKKQAAQVEKDDQEDKIISASSELKAEESLFPRMIKRDSLFVTITGCIKSGFLERQDGITLLYSFVTGPGWELVSGRNRGITQIASPEEDKVVWDCPFEVAYETTSLMGWPQLIVSLYGTDFFARSMNRGYGNTHVPLRTGEHSRRIQLFEPLPQSVISGFFGYWGGSIAEYKDPQKVLSMGTGREVTRVKTVGQIDVSFSVQKHNFDRFGFS